MPGQGRKPLPPPDASELRRLVEIEGLSIPDLAQRYGRSRTPVMRWLKTLGIEMPKADFGQARLDDCWIWGGAKDGAGYGIKWFKPNKVVGVHRLAWAWVHGPIPKGMIVMHKCDNPPCCNPDHLELGTPHKNALDMKAKRRVGGSKTHCRQGHPITEDSIYYHTQSGGGRVRKCRECDKAALAVYRHHYAKDMEKHAFRVSPREKA